MKKIVVLLLLVILVGSAIAALAKSSEPAWERKCGRSNGLIWDAACELLTRVETLEDDSGNLTDEVEDLDERIGDLNVRIGDIVEIKPIICPPGQVLVGIYRDGTPICVGTPTLGLDNETCFWGCFELGYDTGECILEPPNSTYYPTIGSCRSYMCQSPDSDEGYCGCWCHNITVE